MAKAKNTNTEESGFSEIASRFKAHPFLFGGTVVVLVIVIIAFVFVPTLPSIQQGDEGVVFGYYNGKPITQNRYFWQVLRETAYMAGFDLQSDYNMNSGAAYQVWYQAFIRTMMHMALLDEMARTGYTAPEEEINRLVAANPEFMEDGRFSVVKYRNYSKTELAALWKATAEGFITEKYTRDFIGLKVPSGEKSFIGAMAFPERTFQMVSIPRSAYPDSELSAFAASRPEPFMTIHLSRITMAGEKEARQLLDSVRGGKTSFEDAARNHSTDFDKDKGGDMGLRMAYEMYTYLQEEADRASVASLRKGEFSPLLKAPNNSWIFFRAEETPYRADLSQEENLAKVRSYMNQFEGGRLENWLVARMEELAAGAKERDMGLLAFIESLKEKEGEAARFAALESVNTGTFGPVNLNYGNMGGSRADQGIMLFTHTLNIEANPELSAAISNEIFWRNIFFTPLNASSAPFTLGDAIAVLTPVEETAEDEASSANIANFYTWGWMYNSIQMDINSAFMASAKFENNFISVMLPMLFGGLTGQ